MRRIPLLLTIISIYLLAGCSPQKKVRQAVHPEKDTALANAITGICIYEEATGKMLLQHNAHKQFIPASNTKILTAFAVMKYLPDSLPGWFIHETADTLYLKPNGDPTFLHPDFAAQKILELLKQNRKPVVLVQPASTFTSRGFGWAWNNFQEFYMPERSVMPIYGNVVRFRKQENNVIAFPAYFQSQLSVNTTDISKPVNVRREENGNGFIATTASANYLMRPFTQKEEQQLTYQLLADTLRRLGIAIPICSNSSPAGSFLPYYTQHTDSVLQYMMHNSDNFFAEQLLLMTGTQMLGKLSDRPAIDTLLRSNYASLPDHPRWVDGSGLSRNNLISPLAFVTLLNKMKKELPWQRLSKVMVNGNMGSLKGLYINNEERIFAKTGTLNGQAALSGYLITKKGKHLSFSFLVNNHQAPASAVRQAIAKTLNQIIDHY